MKFLRSELPFPSFTAPEWHDSSPTFSHLSVSHLTASPDLPPKPPDPPNLLYSRYYLSMESFVHLLRPETLCSYHLPSTSLECYVESLPMRLAGDLASTDHVIAVGCCFDGNFRRMAVIVASDPGGKSTWAAGPIMQIRVSCLISFFGLWPFKFSGLGLCNLFGLGPCKLHGLCPCITYGLCFCLPCFASTAALTTERYIITDKERLISFFSPDWERFVPALPLSRKG